MPPPTTCAIASRASWACCPKKPIRREIIKADASAEPVMFMSFSSDNMSMLEVTDYAERNLIDRFSTVPGVARVSIGGGRRYAMRFWIDRQALAARRLTVADIEDALRRENVELPAGRLESGTREFSLRTLVGLDNGAGLSQSRDRSRRRRPSRAARRGRERPARRRKRAHAHALQRAHRRRYGDRGAIERQYARRSCSGVRAELDRIRETLPKGAYLAIGLDNGVAIEAALHEVVIAIGFALVSRCWR